MTGPERASLTSSCGWAAGGRGASRSRRPQTWARSEGGGGWAARIPASLFPTPAPQHTRFLFGSKVVGLGGLGFFFFLVYEIFSFFPSPSPEKKVLFCLQWWALTSRSSGGGGGELVGWRSGVLAAEACRRGSELSRRSQAPFPP